jgi:hypothetical protein
MHDEIRTLLNAYMDGELHGTRLQEMKLHLGSCESCRGDLEELRLVSNLLQAAPLPDFMSADRFVSNLTLILPRRNLRDLQPKSGSLAWWLVPTGLLGAWFFVQTVSLLGDGITAAQTTGLLGRAATWLGGGQQTLWFTVMTSFSGAHANGLQPTLSLLNNLDIFGVNLLTGFLWQALIVLLYWGWLLLWWHLRRPQPLHMENAS